MTYFKKTIIQGENDIGAATDLASTPEGEYNAEEFTLQPGEWITLAAKSLAGTPSYVTGTINTREDQ